MGAPSAFQHRTAHSLAFAAGLSFLLLALISAAGTATHAQSNCLLYQSGSTPPSGYGASYGVFSAQRPLLVYTNCPTAGTAVTLSVGQPGTGQLVYRKAYVYRGSAWGEVTLSGTVSSGDWLASIGTAPITVPSSASAASPVYMVGYVCTNQGGAWKCGCSDSACATGKWQLQGYIGGGATTGTATGGATTGGGQPVGSETALCYPQTGRRTVPVADRVELAGRLTQAQPGDHLVLAGGTYLGFTYSKDGTANDPIVIKPAPGALATFTGTVTMGGSYGVLAGFSFNSSGRIKLTGHHNRITRNYFFDQKADGVIEAAGDGIHDNRIDHNHFHRITGAAYRSDQWSNDGAEDNQGIRIDHNYFQDHSVYGGNESVAVMMGDAYSNAKLLYDHNLFDNVLQGYEAIKQSELISVKTSGTTLRGNTIINSPSASMFSLRQSNDTIVESNYLEGASIRVMGDDHIIRGNKIIGGKIIVSGGEVTMDARFVAGCQGADKYGKSPMGPPPACKPEHAAARRTLVENNIGTIVVGDNGRGPLPAQNTTLRNNSGSISFENHTGTNRTDGTPNNNARKLTPSDVGRSAPDPSCQ